MEKTLSDWIVEKDVLGQDRKIGYIHEAAVKEFIRLLKEKLIFGDSHEIIDKLAGERLI